MKLEEWLDATRLPEKKKPPALRVREAEAREKWLLREGKGIIYLLTSLEAKKGRREGSPKKRSHLELADTW